MIYLKSVLAGLAAVLSSAALVIVSVFVALAILSHRPQESGSVGWDPISIMRPVWWLVVAMAIFGVGFLWEFRSLNR